MSSSLELQAQLAQARSAEEYVDMLQHGVEHFPRTALFWRLYAEHVRSTSGPEAANALLVKAGGAALPWCRCDPELWRVAAESLREATPRDDADDAGANAVGAFFERAVAVAGGAPDSRGLWSAYAEWASNGAPVAKRKAARKAVLQRAALVPGEGLDEMWRAYDADCRDGGPSERDARDLAKALEPWAVAARKDALARTQLWHAARHADGDELGKWRIVVAYEREVAPAKLESKEATPAELEANALHVEAGRRRVAAAYRAACDANAGDAPELFLEFADWCHDAAPPAEAADAAPLFPTADGPLFAAAPRGSDAAVAALEEAGRAAPASVLVQAARANLLDVLDRYAEAEAVLEALCDAAPLTDDPDAGDNERDAAPWALLERHARRHSGKEAGRAVFARTRALRVSKQLSAKIYEAHAAIEAHMNRDTEAARKVLELGLAQRPELLVANDATYVLSYAAFLEADCGKGEDAVALLERAVQARGEKDAPAVLWDALASLHHRSCTSRNAAFRARQVEKRRRAAGKAAVGGCLAPLWREVSSTRAIPLNDTDTAWRHREAVPAVLTRDLASVRDVAAKLEATRADGLLADEYDNGGLDASDLEVQEADGVAAALARGKLPENLKRVVDLVHHKGRRGAADPQRVAFVLDALKRSVLPPPPTKKRARDGADSEEEDDAGAGDVFRKRRAAQKAADAP